MKAKNNGKIETRGRKPLPPDELRTAQIRLWVSDSEKAVIESASGDKPAATWAREVLLRAAKRAKG